MFTVEEVRLGQAGREKGIGSVYDAFDSVDDTIEGNSGPISRTIGSRPIDFINWLLPLQRLLIGTEGAEISARSSSLDEQLTPTNFGLKTTSTYGSAAVAAVAVDDSGPIGRAHVCTPDTNAHLVCRHLIAKKKTIN